MTPSSSGTSEQPKASAAMASKLVGNKQMDPSKVDFKHIDKKQMNITEEKRH